MMMVMASVMVMMMVIKIMLAMSMCGGDEWCEAVNDMTDEDDFDGPIMIAMVVVVMTVMILSICMLLTVELLMVSGETRRRMKTNTKLSVIRTTTTKMFFKLSCH